MDYRNLDQFEFDGKKYSLFGRYPVTEFCHRFIDGEFPSCCAYLIPSENRPSEPVYYLTVLGNIPTLIRYYKSTDTIAVYEQMQKLTTPEKICGNCAYYCRHYAGSDNSLGIVSLGKGHCTGRQRIFDRKREDRPKSELCFKWNAECTEVIEKIKKLNYKKEE